MIANLIESWNHAAAAGANFLLDRALASGAVLLVVAVASAVLRRRASAHLLSWLWLLPLVPLALPLDRLMPSVPNPGIPLRALVARIAPEDPAADSPVLAHDGHLGRELSSAGARPRETARVAPSSPADRPAAGSPDGTDPPVRPSVLAWVMLAWASVAAALLLRLAICQKRTSRDLAANAPLQDHEACRMLPQLRHAAGVSVPVVLVVSETLASPATWGWRRPVIILPRSLLDRLDAAQLRWVLLHELAHVRRGDLAVAWIQRLVTILWWFNPLVWLTNALAEGQRECACDDAASARCEARSRRSCAEALFEIVAGSSRPRDATPALATLVDHRSLVRKRLMRLLDPKRPVPAGLTPLSAVVLLACTALSLTAARSQAPVGAAPDPTTPRSRVAVEIDRAVTWLRGAQEADGRWRVSPEAGRIFNGIETETSTTALAVLALMDAETRGAGADGRSAIERGIAWLEQHQSEDGSIGPRQGAWTYGHAMATLALSAAQRRAPRPERLERVARAVTFIQEMQNPYRGWRYGYRDGDNDSKMTSLMMLALLEARSQGIEVAEQSIVWGFDWIASMTDPETGRVGWLSRGGAPGRLAQTRESHPPELSEEVTALATLTALAAGQKPDEDPSLRKGIELVLDRPPTWSEERGSIDYSYWYWGSRLAATLDQPQRAAWEAALVAALVPHARTAPTGGIWPLEDAWSLPGLEVYATAANLRALCTLL